SSGFSPAIPVSATPRRSPAAAANAGRTTLITAAAGPRSAMRPPRAADAAHARAEPRFVAAAARELRSDPSLVHTEDAARQRHDLLQTRRHEQHARARGARREDPRVDEFDRSDVHPARRLRAHEEPRLPLQLARDHELLLVAARQRA